MNALVKSLLIGLLVAIILVPIVRWFWRRFDRPSKAVIEHQEELKKQREEQRTWNRIEREIEAERLAAESKAIDDRRRAELRERARPPSEDVKSEAFAALGSTEPLRPVVRDDIIEHEQIRQDITIEALEEEGPPGPPDEELMVQMQSDMVEEIEEEFIPEVEETIPEIAETIPEVELPPAPELPPVPDLPDVVEEIEYEDDWGVEWR